jgi:diguanylate cyclase (GGDEF)-like protein
LAIIRRTPPIMELLNTSPGDVPVRPGRTGPRATLIRLGYLRSMLAITGGSVAASLALTLALQWFTHVPPAAWLRGAIIAVTVPLVVAPAAAHYALSLLFELEHAYSTLHQFSIRDPLTHAYNRRFFTDQLVMETERALRSPLPLSLLIMDADEFTLINDRYGHSVGDRVLQALTAACKGILRPYDIMARYGGEEFVFLLPDTTLGQACEAGERIRAAVANQRIERERGAPIRVTVSLGVAQLGADDADGSGMMRRADAALYRAKHSGRNRVES